MANNIKGIVVEIGGNTGPLNDALKSVNKTTSELKNELKEVEKQLRLDPTNTVLLQQKQELLSQSISNTSERLAILKEAERQAQVQFEQGNIGAEQYRALQREVINTEQQLNSLNEAQQNLTSSNNSVSQSTTNVTEKFATVGKVVAVSMAATATAVGGLAIAGAKMSEDLQKALNGLQASTGATTKETEEFKQIMTDIYANNFGESFEDIGIAMGTIAQQSGLTGKALQEVTENAMALRDTFGFEINESFRSAKMLMDQFGISSKEAYNLIAQGAQDGLNKNDNLLDSINEYSVHFKQMGFDSTEMFNMFSNGAKTGVFDVDKLGDAIKEFGIRSKDGSKATTEAFTALGLDANKLSADFAKGGETGKQAFELVNSKLLEMKDPLIQNQVGTALWGTMWEDMGVKSITALVNTKGGISTTKNALDEINAVKYNTFGEAMTGIKRQLEVGLILPIGESVMPMLNKFATFLSQNMPQIIDSFKPVIEGLNSTFTNFGQYITENMPQIQNVFQTIGGVIGIAFARVGVVIDGIIQNFNILMPVLTGALAGFIAFKTITTVITVFNLLKTTLAGVTTVQAALNLVMALNPIGLVAIAIGVLIAAGVALYMNWDTVVAYAKKLWAGIKESFKGISETIEGAWKGIKDVTSKTWEGIKKVISIVLDTLKIIITTYINVYKTVIITVWNGIKAITSTAWGGIKSVISTVLDTIKTVISNTFNTVKTTVANVWNGIKTAIEKPINATKDVVKKAVDSISGFFKNLKIPEIKIPKIKLPHFEIKGKFSLEPPQVPSLGVNWYAQGGIFNAPSIIGVGEAGTEAVIPLDRLEKMLGNSKQGSGEIINNFNISNMNVNSDTDIKKIARELYNLQKVRDRRM